MENVTWKDLRPNSTLKEPSVRHQKLLKEDIPNVYSVIDWYGQNINGSTNISDSGSIGSRDVYITNTLFVISSSMF